MARPSAPSRPPRSRDRNARRPTPAARRERAARLRRARLRAAGLLALAVLVGLGAALALHDGGEDSPGAAPVPPGSGPGQRNDPLRYDPARQQAFVGRATKGLAHPLFQFSPGGAVASARRVDVLRPAIEAAAGDGSVVDADTLEGMVFLESAGRPDAMASNDLHGAVGLTQILAETGQSLLKMRVDVAASTKLTRQIRRGGPQQATREAERRRVDERFDPVTSLRATVRYLAFARGELSGRLDLAVASYHMGVGNLQTVLGQFGAGDVPYAELFFGATPLTSPKAQATLAGFGDDSATYLWRVKAAEAIMRAFRRDPQALQRQADLQTSKNSSEEVLHPKDPDTRFATAEQIDRGTRNGTLQALSTNELAQAGVRLDPQMGELAPRLGEPKGRYRALRPDALAVLTYLGRGVKAISGSTKPLTLTSSVRDDAYQRLLTKQNIEATRSYSLHTTGFTFDVLRRYQDKRQALAFQFLLDRLTALDLIAWVREPAAIHITVAADARQVLTSGP